MTPYFHYIALSKNKEQIDELADYIHELYKRVYLQEDEDYALHGFNVQTFYFEDYYIITGCNSNCLGLDLGYWAKKENKSNLLEDIIFFELNKSDTGMRRYMIEYNNTKLNTLIDLTYFCIVAFYKFGEMLILAKQLTQDLSITEDLATFICVYFYDLPMWSSISSKYKYR